MPFPPNATVTRGRAYLPDGTFVGAVCRLCGTETAPEDLVRSRRETTGYTTTCRPCHRARNAAAVPAARAAYRSRTTAQIDADYDRLRAPTGGLKRCRACGQYKPKAAYAANRSMPDGRSSECRPCTSVAQSRRKS